MVKPLPTTASPLFLIVTGSLLSIITRPLLPITTNLLLILANLLPVIAGLPLPITARHLWLTGPPLFASRPPLLHGTGHLLSSPVRWHRIPNWLSALRRHSSLGRGPASSLLFKNSFLKIATKSSKMCGLGFQPIASTCYQFFHGALLLRLCCREYADVIPLRIRVAFEKRDQLHSAFKHRRSHFALSVGLVPKAKGQKLVGIPTIRLAQKREAYPPRGHDIYETPEARKIWEEFQARTPYPDRRGGKTWKPLHKLNPKRLQHTVEAHESAIIRDTKTDDIIGIVIRNFTNNNQRLLDWIDGIIAENTGSRKSVRVGFIPRLCLCWSPKPFSS